MKPKPKALSAAMAGLLAPKIGRQEELKLAVAHQRDRVVVQMPVAVQVLTLTPDQAEAFAQALVHHAGEARAAAAH